MTPLSRNDKTPPHVIPLLLAGIITILTFLVLPLIVGIPSQPKREPLTGFTTIANFALPNHDTPDQSNPADPIETPPDTPPPSVIPKPLKWTPPKPIADPPLTIAQPPPPPPVREPSTAPPADPTPSSAMNEATNDTATTPHSTTNSIGRPTIISRPRPPYPRMAKYRGIEGYVDVRLTITPDGGVDTVEILKANPPGVFDKAVRQTVPKWRFSPATRNATAIPASVETRIRFELR